MILWQPRPYGRRSPVHGRGLFRIERVLEDVRLIEALRGLDETELFRMHEVRDRPHQKAAHRDHIRIERYDIGSARLGKRIVEIARFDELQDLLPVFLYVYVGIDRQTDDVAVPVFGERLYKIVIYEIGIPGDTMRAVTSVSSLAYTPREKNTEKMTSKPARSSFS